MFPPFTVLNICVIITVFLFGAIAYWLFSRRRGHKRKPKIRIKFKIKCNQSQITIIGDSMKVLLPDSKKFNVQIEPISKAGNPTEVENIVWDVSDPEVVTLEPAEDGLSAYVIAGKIGTAQITVMADALIGEGEAIISDILEVTVIAGQAVGFGFKVGEFEDK